MKEKRKEQPISLKFLLFLFIGFIVIVSYISIPNDMKKIEKNKTYEEMLEYSRPNNNSIAEYQEERAKETIKQEQNDTSNLQTLTTITPEQIFNNTQNKTVNYKTDANFKKLLNDLTMYPPHSIPTATIIANKLLEYKGYSADTLNVTAATSFSQGKTPGSYTAAYFNIATGDLIVNSELIYKYNNQYLTAIIAHELDHFEKMAQICKSMGVNNFIAFMHKNNIYIQNKDFWERAILKTDITDFNEKYYKEALERYVNQNKTDLISTYTDFNIIAEHIRNPLEISAYEVSDFILNYYNLPKDESPLRNLVLKFNSVDWEIYNLASKNTILNDERIAIFDYLLSKAIIISNSKYSDIYKNCINNAGGDLTQFWLAFKNDNISFYGKSMQIDTSTYNNFMNILDTIYQLSQSGLSANNYAEALRDKAFTLKENLIYDGAFENLKKTVEDYLNFTNQNNIIDPKAELKMILLLINIENIENQKNNSLYYIKVPILLTNLYPQKSKGNRFNFIYQNPEFKNIFNTQKTTNPNITEQKLLLSLLEKNKISVK